MKPPIVYPVHERFSTWQGEGVHMGRAAFFIRTYGCPVQCPWCDSAGTWHKDFVPKDIQRMTVEQLVGEALVCKAPIVVITGGEPTVYDLDPLTRSLQENDLNVHLETSGAFEIKGLFDWVTVSPKRWKEPLSMNVMLADEFKFIIERPEDIDFYYRMICALGHPERCGTPIWLHPEWSHHKDARVLEAISKVVKMNPEMDFRAGWQLHKLYCVDALDVRSRPLVPLGGDLSKGF